MRTAPRTPVSSARQLALGVVDDETPPADGTPALDAVAVGGTHTLAGGGRWRARRARAAAFVRQMNPRKATEGYPSRPIWVMATSAALQGVSAATIGANFAVILIALNISDKAVIGLSVALNIVNAVTGVGFGNLSDRFGRVKLAVAGCIGFGIGTVAFGVWPTAALFFLARIGQSVFGLTWGNVTTLPLLSDYYPPEVRGRVFAVPQTIGSLGGVVGPILGGLLGHFLGWRTAVLITGIPATLSFVLFLLLREPQRGYWDRVRLGVNPDSAAIAPRPPSFAESWRIAKSVRTLRRIWLANVFNGLAGTALIPVLLVVVRGAIGTDPIIFGLVAAIGQLSLTIGIAVGGTLVDVLVTEHRPGRVLVVQGYVYLLNMVALIVVSTVHVVWILLPVLVLLPFVNGLIPTAQAVLTSQVIPARVRAFGLQTSALWGLLPLVFIPLVLKFAGNDPIHGLLLITAPLVGISALIYITSSTDVEHDIEDARQAAVAEEEMASSRRQEQKAKLLVCRKVDVHYDGVQVLFSVDFDVDEGELVALLGTNGAGKSTLLRAISGLSQATGGAIYLDDRDITHTPPHELARFGVVQMPGGKGVFPALSVEDNLAAATWLDLESDVESDGNHDPLAAVFELFPALEPRRAQLAGSLSGGEQQMLALGQAFLMKPKILLIDELSLGLAPAIVEQLLRAVERIHHQGTAVVLVEQSVNLALTVADRAVFLEKGEVRFSGATADLLARPDILRSVYLRGSGGAVSAGRASRPVRSDGATVLAAEGISVRYGGVDALRGASVSVAAAEIVGVIGPNGAGKTTLFDAISGFVVPDAGTVRIAGKDASKLGPDDRARLGLARSFQDGRLFPSLTVRENVAVALQRRHVGAPGVLSGLWLAKARAAEGRLLRHADELIDLLGLGDFRDKFASELSTGSRRVVDLACVMAVDPEVLLLDEPSSGIAQAEAEQLGPLLERLRREVGCGMLVIEHDMKLLTGLADRLIGMVLGEVIVSGTVTEVTTHPELVEAYLGRSERVLSRSGALPSDGAVPTRRTRSIP